MKTDNINKLFDRLQHDFDVEEPNANHNKRFLEKLNAQNNMPLVDASKSKHPFWKPLIGIAASILLLVSVFVGTNTESALDLASVSPEMAETQNFFTSAIETELTKLENQSSPETKLLIKDALIQIQRLETEYNSLKEDLTKSGSDKRVIYAMITNFQNRIDILQETMKQIENIKQLKNLSHENSQTI